MQLAPALVRPAALLLASLAAALGFEFLFPHDATAVSFPIDLKVGTVRSAPFKADYNGLYLVELGTDRFASPAEMECLLGGKPMFGKKACGAPSPVDLSWTFHVDGKPGATVSTSDPTAGWQSVDASGPTARRTVGGVMLRKGLTYQIEIRSLQDASQLASAHPQLSVRAHPGEFKGEGVGRALGVLASLATGVVALLWLAAAAWTDALQNGAPPREARAARRTP